MAEDEDPEETDGEEPADAEPEEEAEAEEEAETEEEVEAEEEADETDAAVAGEDDEAAESEDADEAEADEVEEAEAEDEEVEADAETEDESEAEAGEDEEAEAEDEEADEPEHPIQLGEGAEVEGVPLAQVSARLMWGMERSQVRRREGDTVIRTPDGPRELDDVLDEVDLAYFEKRQEFEDAVRDVVGTGPVPTTE